MCNYFPASISYLLRVIRDDFGLPSILRDLPHHTESLDLELGLGLAGYSIGVEVLRMATWFGLPSNPISYWIQRRIIRFASGIVLTQ